MVKTLCISFVLLCVLTQMVTHVGCTGRNAYSNALAKDTSDIKQAGVLRILTLQSSISYFNYRGYDMGAQYELAEKLASFLGVELDIVVVNDEPTLVKYLLEGKGDLITWYLPRTKNLSNSILYCEPHFITNQVLVQRVTGKTQVLKDVTELIGKEVYVKPGKAHERLNNLNIELGGGIIIHTVNNNDITAEDLIESVAKGELPYTVADNNLANMCNKYYYNLDIKLNVSLEQCSSWAVRQDCSALAEVINSWYANNGTSPSFEASTKKYFEISKITPYPPILSIREGKISKYDSIFKQYAQQVEWDWRLLAALAYTESNFDTAVVSLSGAQGLMQLMPATAYAMGMEKGKEQDPQESVKAAVACIQVLNGNLTTVKDKRERLYFILAAYNAGIGHVLDAMALTKKYGKDPYTWTDSVDEFLLLKSNEQYYTDSVCKNGYLRGIETYNFVRDVINRYNNYKRKIPL